MYMFYLDFENDGYGEYVEWYWEFYGDMVDEGYEDWYRDSYGEEPEDLGIFN